MFSQVLQTKKLFQNQYQIFSWSKTRFQFLMVSGDSWESLKRKKKDNLLKNTAQRGFIKIL